MFGFETHRSMVHDPPVVIAVLESYLDRNRSFDETSNRQQRGPSLLSRRRDNLEIVPRLILPYG